MRPVESANQLSFGREVVLRQAPADQQNNEQTPIL